MDLLELLRRSGVDGDVDFLREALRVLMDAIMDSEVSARIGAEHGERSPDRLTHRNGYRSRAWDTRVGTMELRIPKLREGSYFPSLLEPRWRSEKALLAMIQQAYVEGVSTRRVDDLVKALGCEGISKSQVSRICKGLGEVVDNDDVDQAIGDYDSRINTTLPAGRHTVEATTYGQGITGEFTLSIAMVAVDGVPDPAPPSAEVDCATDLAALTEDVSESGE